MSICFRFVNPSDKERYLAVEDDDIRFNTVIIETVARYDCSAVVAIKLNARHSRLYSLHAIKWF